MKKLKLNPLGFGNVEVLTREQLKNVLGGQGCTMTYQNPSGIWHTEHGSCSSAPIYVGQVGSANLTFNVSFCQTATFPGPVELSSNGGNSRC